MSPDPSLLSTLRRLGNIRPLILPVPHLEKIGEQMSPNLALFAILRRLGKEMSTELTLFFSILRRLGNRCLLIFSCSTSQEDWVINIPRSLSPGHPEKIFTSPGLSGEANEPVEHGSRKMVERGLETHSAQYRSGQVYSQVLESLLNYRVELADMSSQFFFLSFC